MEENSGGTQMGPSSYSRGPAYVSPAATPGVDKFPKNTAEWNAFAALPAEARSAVYLRSIRAMVMFFTVVSVITIVASVILVAVGINAAHQATVTTNPFG